MAGFSSCQRGCQGTFANLRKDGGHAMKIPSFKVEFSLLSSALLFCFLGSNQSPGIGPPLNQKFLSSKNVQYGM